MENGGKKISLFKLITFTICSILVLDSFVSPTIIGVSSITIWIITAVVFFLPYGLINSELGSTYPDDGGMVSWIGRAFGEKAAVYNGWFYWVNVAIWVPAVFVAFSGWFNLAFMPNASNLLLMALALLMCWIVVYIGIRGVEMSVAVSNVAAICKVTVLLIFGFMDIVYGIKNGLANDFSLRAFIPSFDNTLNYVPVIIYNLLGFELIASVGSEIDKPEKNIPKMTVFAGAAIAALYIFGTFGVLAAIPAAEIDTVDGFYYALMELASIFGPAQKVVVSIIMIVALLTLVSNMVSWGMGAVESLEGIGLQQRSKLLGHTSKKYGTKDYAYILMGTVATVLIVFNFLLSGDANEMFWNIFSFGSIVFMIPYLFMFAAVIILRKKDPEAPRLFKVPGGKIGLWICVIMCEFWIVVSIALLVFVPFDLMYHGMLVVGLIICALFGWKLCRNKVN